MKGEGKYARVCRRCNEFFRTNHKRSKYCNDCKRPTWYGKEHIKK